MPHIDVSQVVLTTRPAAPQVFVHTMPEAARHDSAIVPSPPALSELGDDYAAFTQNLKRKITAQREWYAREALRNGWGREALVDQIEAHAFERAGKAPNNFDRSLLPQEQAYAAVQVFKDPYRYERPASVTLYVPLFPPCW